MSVNNHKTIAPQNFEERVVWYSITGTYAFYAIGALYILAPVIVWSLLFYLIYKWYFQKTPKPKPVPLGIWIWIIAMLFMELALIMGHLDWELGTGKLIKSSIGWAKGWALLAIFPLLGACLNIRPELIYRAACIVCYHTILPTFTYIYWCLFFAFTRNSFRFTVKSDWRPRPRIFSLTLYGIDPGSGTPRWRFFTPWAPAVGFVANIYFIFALQEKQRKWFWFGIAGCLAMIFMSKSRLALVSMVFVPIFAWGLSNLIRPMINFLIAFASLTAGLLAAEIIEFIELVISRFKGARAGSSRVRSTLGEIAIQRWRDEAPIWGHGIVERGPHLVEYMPIGSHHSWYGLLFVKGIVGFYALLIPMLWSFLALMIKAQSSKTAQTGLAILLILFLYILVKI